MLGWRERKKRERNWRGERREFVYLDEVSVTSLIAARDGSIADTITEKLSRTAEAESKMSISVPLKAAKFGSESRNRVTDTSSREVVRRTVIQGTFGDLRTGGSSASLPLIREYRDLPKRFAECVGTPADLNSRRRRKLSKYGLLTPVDALRRGDVVEIHVRLRPNRMFSIVSAIESFVDIMQGRSEVFGDASGLVAEATPIAEVIDRLMVGLIPIHGAPTNIALVDIDGEPHLMDTRVIRRGSPFASDIKPWELVAVTEEASYWKDLRRVLYTRDRFTIYARIVSPSLGTTWNPVKLAELMSDVSDDVAREIMALPRELERQLDQTRPEPTIDLYGMFQRFAESLAVHVDTAPDAATVTGAITEAVEVFNSANGDMSLERAAFDSIVVEFEKVNGSKLDRETVAENRTTVRAAALVKTATPIAPEPASARANVVQQLEVEVVAIYW